MATKTPAKDKSKADSAQKPIRPPRKLEMSLRVQFTEKELLEIGKKLAEMQIDLPGLDNSGSEMKGDGKIVQLDMPRRVSSSGAVVTEADGDSGTNNGEDKAD